MELEKLKRLIILLSLVVAFVGLMVMFRHPILLTLFVGWIVVELLWKNGYKEPFSIPYKHAKKILKRHGDPFPGLQTPFNDWSQSSVILLEEELCELRNRQDLSPGKRRELERFTEIVELRKLRTFPQGAPRKKVRQLFIMNKAFRVGLDPAYFETLAGQDIMESATIVAHLYQKIAETARNPVSYYRELAQRTLQESLKTSSSIEKLSDQIQQHGGISFLVLNLIKHGELSQARVVVQRLLKEEWDLEEDLRSALYWMAELLWFAREMASPLKDYETSMRYLYHICFTAPERAHFLEIDSQYFSQFEVVNELAREAFLFKENLIQRFLELWASGEGAFDSAFIEVLEVMTQLKSKIYEDRATWQKIWDREKEWFSKDYLYVVEGNLSYAKGHFSEARTYFEKALKVNPGLRAALLNNVFAYAALGEKELHGWMVDRILNHSELSPSNLYVAGNSCLLMGQDSKADEYYSLLAQIPGWALKTNIYRSTFCYENRLYEKALQYARQAERDNPEDSGILYHLSLCFAAVGEKDKALEVVKRLEDRPHWMDYYRFTLERDSGRGEDAAETLLGMPAGYFEDPEELEAAISFAKNQKDLRLLRHLKSRS